MKSCLLLFNLFRLSWRDDDGLPDEKEVPLRWVGGRGHMTSTPVSTVAGQVDTVHHLLAKIPASRVFDCTILLLADL